MGVTRRETSVFSGAVGAGLALTSLGIDWVPECYAEEIKKIDKSKTAKQSTSIRRYGAVGVLTSSTDAKTGKIINVEGDPEDPINEGSLCAKGAGTFQTTGANEHLATKVCTELLTATSGGKPGLGHHPDGQEDQGGKGRLLHHHQQQGRGGEPP